MSLVIEGCLDLPWNIGAPSAILLARDCMSSHSGIISKISVLSFFFLAKCSSHHPLKASAERKSLMATYRRKFVITHTTYCVGLISPRRSHLSREDIPLHQEPQYHEELISYLPVHTSVKANEGNELFKMSSLFS